MEAKITDAQIIRHLGEGMKQVEIAAKYDMNPNTLSGRIKKLKRCGLITTNTKIVPEPKKEPENFTVQKLDTFARRSDRRTFRVTEVDEDRIRLKSTSADEYGKHKMEEIEVDYQTLKSQFKKKDYPEVHFYIDPTLKNEAGKSKPVQAAEGKEKETSVKKKAKKQETEKSKSMPEETSEESYTVKRNYLKKIDEVLNAAGVESACEVVASRIRELVCQMLRVGIEDERNKNEKVEEQ